MNKDIFEGKLKEISGEIKKKWGEITDDEIVRTKGNAQALSGLVQQKMGLSKDEASRQVDSFMTSMEEKYGRSKSSLGDKVNEKIEKAKDRLSH
ncbi:hypothetical protein BDW_12215 [Bdellovibrio bacteriovorus W]|nr:hypothetical protein BDW_12215 [Bdellovibrio bacteriovorus W]